MKPVRLALDAFGGDHGPRVVVQGVFDFIKESSAEVYLTGPIEKLRQIIPDQHKQIILVDAPDIIAMEEKASSSIRNRKDSSMYKAVQLVKDKQADACLSAGSSASFMALSVLVLGRLGEIERPALVTPFPTLKDPCYVLDVGATVDSKPIHLAHFALMGQAYAQILKGIPKPKVALISNGEEDTKGNEVTRETNEILKNISGLNYVGYCEGKDLFSGEYDVAICDGFVGNVILKTAEGLAETLMELLKKCFLSQWQSKIGYLLARSSMKPLKKKLDYAEYGAAPLLGVSGISLICHGRSNSLAIKNALHSAEKTVQEDLVSKLSLALSLMNKEGSNG
jgi:glycerol-3-phosphate acyltransferase PlsX